MSSKESELLQEIERLRTENKDLTDRINEVNTSIEAIKQGKIDAILGGDEKQSIIYVPQTKDQSYRNFIEKLPEGILAIYPDGIILYANSHFAAFLSNPVKKIISSNLIDFIAPESKNTFISLLKKAQNQDCQEEIWLVNTQGDRGPFLMSLKALPLDNVMSISVVLTDLTKIKEDEEKIIKTNLLLEESISKQRLAQEKTNTIARQLKEKVKELKTVNTRLEAFAYITSHHLQEPLRKIRTYGGLLISRHNLSLTEEGQFYLERIEAASLKMQKMVDDVLTYSKIANEVEFKICDLNLVMNRVLNELEIKIKETNANIVIPSKLPVLEANANQLEQLFYSLIDNSIKFRKPETRPEITISCETVDGKEIKHITEDRKEGKFRKITIQDKGIGFSNEFADQIFLLFKRLHGDSDFPGTGLGLAIGEKVVDNHNGFISACSEIGKGSTFTVILPCKQNIEDKFKGPIKIMVADDDQDDRNLMAMAFEEINSNVMLEFTSDGQELIDNLKKKAAESNEMPDLILLDLNMPRKDGRVALQEIKADPELKSLNVIIFTTSRSPEDRKTTLGLGASDFVSKPSDFDDLMVALDKIYKDIIKSKIPVNI